MAHTTNFCHYRHRHHRDSSSPSPFSSKGGGESILNKLFASSSTSTSRLIDVVIVVMMIVTVIVPSSLSPSVGVVMAISYSPFGTSSNTASASAASTTGNNNKLQRGKVLEKQFNEHDLLRAYREIQSEYRDKAFGDEYYSNNDDGEEEEEEEEESSSSSSSSSSASQQQQQQWKVLTTMNPNKKNTNDDNDDEIIRVSMLEHPSDPLCPYVKMEAIIPKSVEKCWNFLSLDKWDETMPTMDPFYEGLDIYGNYKVAADDNTDNDNDTNDDNNSIDNNSTIHMILARKRTKRILAFGKREFVFVSVTGDKPLDDGTWVSGTVSVEFNETKTDNDNENGNEGDDENENDTTTTTASTTSLPYRNKSYTRAFQDSIAFYKPIPPSAGGCASSSSLSGERTKLTIICRIDLNDSSSSTSEGGGGGGGCIPMWLYVKTIGITGARSVLNMRRALLEEKDEE